MDEANIERKVGRNDLCPCGSGKYFNKCCLYRSEAQHCNPSSPPRFRFEPGSYGGPGRTFLPSIACLKHTEAQDREYHFGLSKIKQQHAEEDDAVGEYRRSKGYVSVKDFKVINA